MLFEMATLIVLVAVVTAIIWAIVELKRGTNLRRIERTLNDFPAIREEYFDLKRKIYSEEGTLTPHGENLLRMYLSKMERFSVGVHCKMYDISIINKMSGKVLIGQYHGFICNYIAGRKEKGMVDSTYAEYELLIRKVEDLRKMKSFRLSNGDSNDYEE
jgi:hypothetical protein